LHSQATSFHVIGNSSASKSWYLDPTDRPVKRLQKNLQIAFSSFKVSLPSDSPCMLTATTNVVGRYMNGVPMESVCSRGATSRHATGVFVHAEQALGARDRRHYAAWAEAVVASFEAVCGEDGTMDRGTGLCVERHKISGRLGLDGTTEETMIMDRLVWNPWYLSVCYFMML
jgi:hypothetical protein